MISGTTGAGNNPPRDFSAPNFDSIFGHSTCICGCCNGHQNAPQPENKQINVESGKQSQVLTFPESKTPISGFNESRRVNMPTSNAPSWKPDFQCPSCPHFKFNDLQQRQQQPANQMSHQHCCFPPMMGGGSVEIVKVGEGPPLTWADLQRHGAFAFPDGSDWATTMQPQRTLPMQPSLQVPAYKCPYCKSCNSNEQKRPPISEYSNWSQRKKTSQPVFEVPPECMIHQQSPLLPPLSRQQAANSKPNGYFFDQSKLTTTTAQTEPPINCPQCYHHPTMMTDTHAICNQCPCGAQNFIVENWQVREGSNPMRTISDVQQKKFSLPPASHHSPEQRTSYRAKRIF